jgi:response regulator NasT
MRSRSGGTTFQADLHPFFGARKHRMKSPTAKLRIAVVDDEPEMLEFYEMALMELGHEVVVKAANGKALIEDCLALKPDLVITDIKMPDMDGLDAATQLRGLHPMPVILVSAYHEPGLTG